MVQLGSTQKAMFDTGGTELLSFLYQEIHLFAWNGQANTRATQNPPSWAGPTSHHFYAPTWVISSHYKARRYVSSFPAYKCIRDLWHDQCGIGCTCLHVIQSFEFFLEDQKFLSNNWSSQFYTSLGNDHIYRRNEFII